MSLFSFLRKNKQETASDDGAYYSRAEEASQATRSRSKRKSAPAARRDEPIDPVLPEKKRARRRLIGAVALVLAAVIGLPMILDAEPNPLAEDIAIQIPSRDSVAPVPAPAPAADAAQLAAASLDPTEEVIAVPPSAPPTAASAAPAPVPPLPAAPLSAPKPSTVAATPPVAAAAPAASPIKLDDGARAMALLEGRPDPRAAEKKAEKVVIQIAALASQEKVNELQSRLKGAGIKSYTQKVATESGDRTRVRVGPFANRDEAEKVRARIVKLGLNGTLVPV